ncbi:hypothetical protein AB8U03_13545 [Clostridium sp. Mt-5]|uniref:Uncharacterized protein n=1 Tax=Clostridium moutaii TaxID=3240932 RepID=A0ABV4BUK6_9CLOT
MGYVDSNYYKNTFKGTIVPDSELDTQLGLASDNIDSLTYNSIIAAGFDSLTSFQQDKVQKAVCLQAEFLYQYGDFINLPVNNYSAGSISLNLGNSGNGIKTPNTVIHYLKQTGLTCRIL